MTYIIYKLIIKSSIDSLSGIEVKIIELGIKIYTAKAISLLVWETSNKLKILFKTTDDNNHSIHDEIDAIKIDGVRK